MVLSAGEVNSRAIIYSSLPLDYHSVSPAYPTQVARILVLHPGAYGQPLQGHLIPQDLNARHIPYSALSYVGGDATRASQAISINGRYVGITSNLHAALVHIRRTTSPRYLWVDYLCVDQLCIPDKSHHVGLMRRIYGQADEVVAWLGECDETYGCMTPEKLWSDCAGSYEAMRSIASGEWKDGPPTPETAAALEKFFARPFWKRAWVVQELFFADKVTFWCGPLTLPWDKMEEYLMAKLQSSSPELPTSTDGTATMLFHLVNMKNHKVDRFFAEAPHLEAARPVDRVYGVLGLFDEEYGTMLQPSYHKSYQTVMVELLRAHVSLGGDLNMITLFEALSREDAPFRTGPACPTFVPTVTKPIPDPVEKYKTPGMRRAPNCFVGDSELVAHGFIISTITGTQGPFVTDARRMKARLARHKLPGGASLVELRHAAMMRLGSTFPRASRDEQSRKFFAMVAGKTPFAHETDPSHAMWETIWLHMEQLEEDGSYDGKVADLVDAFACTFAQLNGRCFFTTASGHIGLGRDDVQPGDMVCVLYGCQLPVVLRPQAGGDMVRPFTFHGGAYVDGVMDGETNFFYDAGCGQDSPLFFTIV